MSTAAAASAAELEGSKKRLTEDDEKETKKVAKPRYDRDPRMVLAELAELKIPKLDLPGPEFANKCLASVWASILN